MAERARAKGLVVRALGALVERDDAAGRLTQAAYWAQRASALAPDDERVRRLVEIGDAAPSPVPDAPAPSSPTATRRTGGWRWGTISIALIAIVLLAIVLRRAPHATPSTQHARVLVAVFENRTGDAGLDVLGRMTEDWITQGIVRGHLADVVDPRALYVRERASSVAPDAVALATRTGATTVVTGSYFRERDTLFFQAAVMDMHSERIVRVVGPILASVRTPVAALDELRSRVMSALATQVDARATQDLSSGEVPPFDAYRDYVDAWDAYWHGEWNRSIMLFLRAARADTAFTQAVLGAASAAANTGDCPLVDSITHALGGGSRPLERVDRVSLQIADARCHGRNDEMLRLALERADLTPGNASNQMAAAAAALWANRPARVLDLLARVNPTVDLGWTTDTTHVAYWSDVTEALHLLGRHEDELTAAARLSRSAPLDRVWLEGRALAALSRPSAVLALLDSALAFPVETAGDLGLAPYTNGRAEYTVTPAWVAEWIARELAFHGDTATARQAAQRALAWSRSRPAQERATYEERLVTAWALETVGSYADAARLTRQLVVEDTANVDFRGELAGLAAEQGDTALADSLDRWLAGQSVERVAWTASVYRARIAALLGRDDDAVARVRDAMDEGAWPYWFHQEPELARLSPRHDLATLLAPKE